MSGARFAACRSIVDTLADEPIEAIRREAGRPATDDDGVVFSKAWTSLKAKKPGKIARRRSTEERTVGQPQHRAMVFRGTSSGPTRWQIRRIGRHPVIGNLVAREELAQLAARRVPAGTDHCYARR